MTRKRSQHFRSWRAVCGDLRRVSLTDLEMPSGEMPAGLCGHICHQSHLCCCWTNSFVWWVLFHIGSLSHSKVNGQGHPFLTQLDVHEPAPSEQLLEQLWVKSLVCRNYFEDFEGYCPLGWAGRGPGHLLVRLQGGSVSSTATALRPDGGCPLATDKRQMTASD